MLSINDIKQLSAQGRHAEAMAAATKLVKQNPNATSALSIFAFVISVAGSTTRPQGYKRLIGVTLRLPIIISTWRSALFRKVRLIRVRSAI